jgi:hypothetical protein
VRTGRSSDDDPRIVVRRSFAAPRVRQHRPRVRIGGQATFPNQPRPADTRAATTCLHPTNGHPDTLPPE